MKINIIDKASRFVSLSVFLALAFSMFFCSTVSVKKDEFTGATIVSTKINKNSKGLLTSGYFEAVYVKEYIEGTAKPTVVQVKITAPVNHDLPGKEVLVKINGQMFSAPLSDVSGEIHTEKGANEQMIEKKVFNAKIHFTPELEKAILDASSMAYRIGMGADRNMVFEYSEDNIKQLKDFLTKDPNSAK